MKSDSKAVKTMIVQAQRFIPCNQLSQYVETIKEMGVSEEQIRKYSSDYLLANTNRLSDEEDE
ncbi:MAG: hypothetical protein EOM67_16870 [Spirochaetia bacterium]|nr:hypothetical protein [Spirochaetia bacterium]